MNIEIIEARTDLGLYLNGADKGPGILTENLGLNTIIVDKDNIVKDNDKNNVRKNEKYVNAFTKKVFDSALNILSKGNIPLLIGGDHSSSIGSALASQKFHKNIGIIWVDAHADYNTFESTESGNIHGMPLAAITGYKLNSLTNFITNNYVNPKNCVIIGARSIDKGEIVNLKDAGVNIITTEDIKILGAYECIKKAFKIANKNTLGVHVSYDLDVIDPILAPGVSTRVDNGITLEEAKIIVYEILKNKNVVKSIDLVEFNPVRDINNKTKEIALEFLNSFLSHL